jgi:MOSC domain-containing protein YiiM
LTEGKVISIHVAEAAGGAVKSLESVRAVPGRGLEGDRYFAHTGTYSETPGTGRDLTLIESEQIEGIERQYGIQIRPANLAATSLLAESPQRPCRQEFKVGEVLVRGMRLCEPCAYVAGVIGNPTL